MRSSLPYAIIWSRLSSACSFVVVSTITLPCLSTVSAIWWHCSGGCPNSSRIMRSTYSYVWASLSQRMTWYRGTSRCLRSSFFFGSATIVGACSWSATTVSSESMLHLLKLLARASPTNLPRPAVVYRLMTHYIVRPSQPHESTRPMDSVKSYIQSHRQAFERDLADLLRIASVSADSRQRAETRRAADWVVGQLERIGLATELIPTNGHALIYAESPPVPGKPVALVYGHYDVQPPEPLDEWISPPFEPKVRDGNIYARGATDDKGQMLTHVK